MRKSSVDWLDNREGKQALQDAITIFERLKDAVFDEMYEKGMETEAPVEYEILDAAQQHLISQVAGEEE